MKRIFLSCVGLIAMAWSGMAQIAPGMEKVDPALWTRIADAPGEWLQVEILLADQVDLLTLDADLYKRQASLQERAHTVITALQAKAAATQGPLLSAVRSLPGIDQASVKAYWIANVLTARMRPEAVFALAQRAEVGLLSLMLNPEFEAVEMTECAPADMQVLNGREIGHTAIKAPELWKLGYTGAGKKVLIIDSGVDDSHPSLELNYYGRFAPASQAWFAPNDFSTPTDCDGHGTHVTGTVLGLNRSTRDTIGVAPNAMWMASPAIDASQLGTNPECLNGPSPFDVYQWAINPDGNPATSSDLPDVINNSWGSPNPGVGSCTGGYVQVLNALEAAGVAVVFSAGNRGDEGASSIGLPGIINTSVVNTFTVGMINAGLPSFPLNAFSSRGPTICPSSGSLLIKPEVVAPGVNVRSSLPENGFGQATGTSMACPHVSGALLLLREAFPTLTGTQLKEALYYTAADLGPAGEDNDYGMGIIDVKRAYDTLVAQGFTPVQVSRARDARVVSVNDLTAFACDTSVAISFRLMNVGTSPMTSARVQYSFANGQAFTYTWNGTLQSGDTTTVTLPAQTLPLNTTIAFSLEVDQVDGQADYFFLDNLGSGSLFLLGKTSAVIPPVFACTNGNALLTGTPSRPNATLRWYEQPSGGTAIGQGNPFVTAAIPFNTLYYASVVDQVKLGRSDNTGTGIFFQANTPYLRFDVGYSSTLRSVKVYAATAGTRIVQLRNSEGTVIAEKSFSLAAGEHRLQLDFALSPGQNYQLGLASTSVGGLFINTAGNAFPYAYGEIVRITSGFINNQTVSTYYFFYDWEVEVESPCPRTMALVGTIPSNFTAAFTPSTTNLDLAQATTVQFTDNSTGATAWFWDFGDGSTSTAQNPSHAYYTAGDYVVSLSATGPDFCSDAVTATIKATGVYPFNVGIGDGLDDLGTIRLYPNPGEGLFYLDLELNRPVQGRVSVLDLAGKAVLTLDGQTLFRNQIQLDLRQMPAGVYLVRIDAEGRSAVRRLMAE